LKSWKLEAGSWKLEADYIEIHSIFVKRYFANNCYNSGYSSTEEYLTFSEREI